MPLPQAPVPATWPIRASSHVYAADMNTQVRDAVKFLNRVPMLYASQTVSTQSIAIGGGGVDVILDTSLIDNYQALSDANQKKWFVPAGSGGIYLAIGAVAYNSAATNAFGADIAVNGTAVAQGGRWPSTPGAATTVTTVDLIKVTGGQAITLQASNNSGGAVPLLNGTIRFPYLYLQRVASSSGTASLTPPTSGTRHTWATNDQAASAGASGAGVGSFLAEIQQPLQFLIFPPYFRAQTSALQSIPNAVNTQITGLSATGFDNYSAFSANTWTCPVTGLYFVGAQVSFNSGVAGSYVVRAQCTLSSVATTYEMQSVSGATGTMAINGYRFIRFTAGDTMILQGRQNTGGAINTTASAGDSRIMAVWMGA